MLRPLDVANLKKKHFKPMLMRAELSAIRLYDLRHTAASRLLANGEHPEGGAGNVRPLLDHAHNGHVLPRDARYAGTIRGATRRAP